MILVKVKNFKVFPLKIQLKLIWDRTRKIQKSRTHSKDLRAIRDGFMLVEWRVTHL